MRLRCRKLWLLLALLTVPLHSWPQSIPSSHDSVLREGAARFLPVYDWLWWKAQCYQESKLDANAISPAGAMGLAQVMPGTWAEQTGIMKINASPYNPRASSLVGAAYMGRMQRIWKAERTPWERLQLMWASYNAGAGRIIAAQKRSGARNWPGIAPYLRDITGDRNAHETVTYVARIPMWYQVLKAQES